MSLPRTRAPPRAPPVRLSPVYTFVSKGAALCVSLAAVYGYATLPADVRSIFLIPCGAGFTAMFIYAAQRKALNDAPPGQIFLILAMICTSLVLHLLYLPSGLCCFFCLMVAQNELLYAPTLTKRKPA
jgi:hypothetical protein